MTQVPDDLLWQRFHELVNISSKELRDWLASPARESARAVDGKPLPPIGADVLKLLDKRRTDLTDHDRQVMLRVIEIVEEEYAGWSEASEADPTAPAEGLVDDERRRFRLLNVGHDPLRVRTWPP